MSRSIFTPIQIKSMHCSNRILRSATWEAEWNERRKMSEGRILKILYKRGYCNEKSQSQRFGYFAAGNTGRI